MAKTVTIPNVMNPYVVIVNNRRYSYPAGATVEVPDEVANIIENWDALTPDPKAPTNGGSGIFYINAFAEGDEKPSVDTDTMYIGGWSSADGNFSVDKSYDEILNAINSGLLPVMICNRNGTMVWLRLQSVTDDVIHFYSNEFLVSENAYISSDLLVYNFNELMV